MIFSMKINKRKIKQNKKAFAFSITMWIVASLLFASVVILRFAKDELSISQAVKNKLEVEMITDDIVEVLKFYVPTADYTTISLQDTLLGGTIYNFPKEIILDGREYQLFDNISLSIQDTSGLLNIVYDNSEIIAHALSSTRSVQLRLRDTLNDWKDVDDIAEQNGAEQNNYHLSEENKFLKVRNTSFIQNIHELSLLKNFEKLDFALIEQNLYYGSPGQSNLALIKNKNILSQILKVPSSESEALLKIQEENLEKFQQTTNRIKTFNSMFMGFSIKKQLYIKVKAKKGRALSILTTMIDFSFFGRPYMIISYDKD